MLPDLPVELIARQAELIVEGQVVSSSTIKIQKRYKGDPKSERIRVPDLARFGEMVKTQWESKHFFVQDLRRSLGKQHFRRLRERGLVGSTVILFLEPLKSPNAYGLKGTALKFPRSNYKFSAIRVLCGEHVLCFGQVMNPGRLWLLTDRRTPSRQTLEASIRYDRPLYLTFGFCVATGGDTVYNYFYLGLSNLTRERVRVDLRRTLKLMLKATKGRPERELPPTLWHPRDLPAILQPGQHFTAKYRLTHAEANHLDSLSIERGQARLAGLTIEVPTKSGRDVYTKSTRFRPR